jgi:exosortase C (VPDSG-CTERM-specific)
MRINRLISCRKDLGEAAEPLASASPATGVRRRLTAWAAVTVILIICFFGPLYRLADYSLNSDLYSYIPLIPLISLYLIWSRRGNLFLQSQPARRDAVLPFLVGFAILAAYAWAAQTGWQVGTDDFLALMALSFLSFQLSASLLFFGKESLRAITFPVALLIFTVPFPAFLRDCIETFLQYSSCQAAWLLFCISGTPIFRQGLGFELPGVALRVAPECSGIHSTFMLFITSLLAGSLLLRTPWKRALLTFCVFPLAILRNGLRIFIIGQLCFRLGPEMIHSYIHLHGGPIFFVFSLIPFFLLMILLRKSEDKNDRVGRKKVQI